MQNQRWLFIFVFFVVISSYNALNNLNNSVILYEDDKCDCIPITKDFNIPIEDKVVSNCRKCYVFEYNFRKNQKWTPEVCIESPKTSIPNPLLVAVRESLAIMSWQVPLTFPEDTTLHTKICRTLCPLANYADSNLTDGNQNITVELSTSSLVLLDFRLIVSKVEDFVIGTSEEHTVSITPSKSRVFEYNMEIGLRAVRVEASSSDASCMILAIQEIQCPFYDSQRTVEYKGFYQTLTTKSGISITKKTFTDGRMYIVMILKPTDIDCVGETANNKPQKIREKNVTVQVIPSITDKEFYEAIAGAFGFYILLYIFSSIICLFLFVRRRRRGNTETQTVDVESPTIQTYGTNSVFTLASSEEDYSASHESSVENTSINVNRPPSPISLDETDIDKLPDAEQDKNVVRTKTILFVSDLSRKKDKYLSQRSKIYSWNLLTIAIFYGLPVVQLVYINQKIVNLTGNQDLCYYNFLCSHQVWIFSDFNHVYSNIGYIMLGILFLLLVWRREVFDSPLKYEVSNVQQNQLKGIPRHFGLMYAMGWALIMEGILSGSYHVCPNKTNFQFDTAFMYVIATVCMLKLYQSRHPDITAKSHTTWMVLAIVIVIGVGGVLRGGLFFWILFIIAHMVVTFLVSTTIYYMGRWKLDRWIFKRIFQHIKLDIAAHSFRPTYLGRFLILFIAVLLNFALDIYGLIRQPPNFAAFLLAAFIMNLLLYLLYYTIMKIRYKEGIRWIPLMYMVLSFLCWGFALYFFLAKNTSWQVTPALSRERNKHCIILNFFDHHDVWHFLSSCALFFSFMVLFTLDDDLETTPRTKIIVF